MPPIEPVLLVVLPPDHVPNEERLLRAMRAVGSEGAVSLDRLRAEVLPERPDPDLHIAVEPDRLPLEGPLPPRLPIPGSELVLSVPPPPPPPPNRAMRRRMARRLP